MRKFESLFYKIMFAKNYHLYWIAGRTNILSKYIIDVFQFWAWLSRFLSYVISKSSSFLFQTNFELIFAALYCYMYESSKIRSQIFKNLFQTGDINIFALFSIYLRHNLVKQSIKGKFHHWQKMELCKVIHSAKLHCKG